MNLESMVYKRNGFSYTIIVKHFFNLYRPQSLGQGNVFTSVCHSVHREWYHEEVWCHKGGGAMKGSDMKGVPLTGVAMKVVL